VLTFVSRLALRFRAPLAGAREPAELAARGSCAGAAEEPAEAGAERER
jgi:hypothetical protein